ncbi:MAG: Crp/Fnr family transcriptional regulator [Bacteroidota bacterium]
MQFRDFYNSILHTNVADDTGLPYPVSKTFFSKGSIITKYGEVEKAVYLLNSGILEMTIKSYMTEKVIDFFFSNEMFTSLTSFLTQHPSDVQIKALTDCEVEMIAKYDLDKAYVSSLEANQLGRILTEQAYIKKAQREKDFLSKTAEERYAEMFTTHSQYLSQVPVNKIAKYLGIHPESLSRIRKKINS